MSGNTINNAALTSANAANMSKVEESNVQSKETEHFYCKVGMAIAAAVAVLATVFAAITYADSWGAIGEFMASSMGVAAFTLVLGSAIAAGGFMIYRNYQASAEAAATEAGKDGAKVENDANANGEVSKSTTTATTDKPAAPVNNDGKAAAKAEKKGYFWN